MLIRLWRPGDRIFLFGFSRGAYTVRCLAGVLANCGIPTRLENGPAMKHDEWTARRLANIAVKKVYQHAASVPRSNATLREKELMDQRLVLGRNFCEIYASRQDDTSEYPYFIGVFDTVASIASRGSLLVLALITLALTAAAATLLWAFYPAISVFAGPGVSGAIAGAVALVHFAPDRWWAWLVAVLAAIFLLVFAWYATQQ
jgi:hypothetical protein